MTSDRGIGEGSYVGPYRLIERFGEPSSQAEVYRAIDIEEQKPAAVKILKEKGADEIRRFEREAELQGSLDHDNIVPMQYYQPISAKEIFFIASDLVVGTSLRGILDDAGGRLDIKEIVPIFCHLTGALTQAHDRAIHHLDLKPANILIGEIERGPEKTWLIDFGFGLWGYSERSGREHIGYGTVEYWSPEQAAGGRKLTERSDLYSLGVVLYESLTGEVPFLYPGDQAKTIRNIREKTAPPPTYYNTSLPKSLETFFNQALEKDPTKRFSSITEMFSVF